LHIEKCFCGLTVPLYVQLAGDNNNNFNVVTNVLIIATFTVLIGDNIIWRMVNLVAKIYCKIHLVGTLFENFATDVLCSP
jgi:hypothetical protein